MESVAQALSESRGELRAACRALRALAVELEHDPMPFDEAAEGIDAAEVGVVVVGEVNRGKSTLLNALMGTRLFPPRATVCTAVLTELRDGPASAAVQYRGGEAEELRLDGEIAKALRGIVSKKNPRAKEVERVRVSYPNRFARDGVVLVDTPGVNDPVEWREEVTRQAVQRADAAIFLLDPQTPLRQSERTFLQETVHHRVEDRVLFVLNKKDQVPGGDLEAALDRVRTQLAPVIGEPRVFSVASKPALADRMDGNDPSQETGFSALEAELERFLVDERVALLVTSRRKALRLLGMELAQDLAVRRAVLRERDAGLLGRLQAGRAKLRRERVRLEAELHRMEADAGALPDRIRAAAAQRWRAAEEQLLLSQSAMQTLQGAFSNGRQRGMDSLRELVGRTRRRVERELDAEFEELQGSLAHHSQQQVTALQTALQGVVADVSTDPGAPYFEFAGKALQTVNEAVGMPKRSFEDVVGASLIGAGAFAAALFSVAAGAVASFLVGMTHDPVGPVRKAARAAGRAGRQHFEASVARTAESLVRANVAQLQVHTRRQLDAAERSLASLQEVVIRDRAGVEAEVAAVRAREERLSAVLGRLS